MSGGYVVGQLSSAFLTAVTHEDPEVRRRADQSASRWMKALQAMSDGTVEVGSRAPVDGLPAWVTLEVLRGGFASGAAVAAGPLTPEEIAVAERVGIPADRGRLFAHYLTDAGLAELQGLLDAGTYRVDIPEDAALLTVAWLIRAGDRAGALDLLEVLAPYVDRLRWVPKVAASPTAPADHVHRLTAGEARHALASRREHPRVEAQREALAVWNPFTDRMLTLWWSQFHEGRLQPERPDEWLAEARRLVGEYDQLSLRHTRCTKHRRPKENLAILVSSARAQLVDGHLAPRQAGLLQHAVTAMVAKRGAPGSAELAAVRAREHVLVTAPTYRTLAGLAAKRLDVADPLAGLVEPQGFSGPVRRDEAGTDIPEGSPMPPLVAKVLSRARAAPIETLLADGVIPSAEVLAELVPQISATVVASTYPDDTLARLMAAHYRAFRRRRSLLLIDLQQQVQVTELPWVRAVAPHSVPGVHEALGVVRRVGALALGHYPGTILPNPLVEELRHLLELAGLEVPLTKELAADIFMGTYSDKFRRAAQAAAGVVGGTLYAAYYGIDYDQVLRLPAPPRPAPLPRPGWRWNQPEAPDALTFGGLCRQRASLAPNGYWSVAANGTVIEQGQILTTHNLAALVAVGTQPELSWSVLADRAFDQVKRLLELAHQQARPLATVKDAAYAWRQTIFFLAGAPAGEVQAFLDREASSAAAVRGVDQLLGGLRHVAAGGRFDSAGTCPGGRRFLGWTTGPHWILR